MCIDAVETGDLVDAHLDDVSRMRAFSGIKVLAICRHGAVGVRRSSIVDQLGLRTGGAVLCSPFDPIVDYTVAAVWGTMLRINGKCYAELVLVQAHDKRVLI